MSFILVSNKVWHDELFSILSERPNEEWVRIRQKESLTFENLKSLRARKVFIPHWSYFIPEEVFNQFDCVLFHMTDLPYGRGGSPLQNLIVRGHEHTFMTAIKVISELDAGPIYLKKKLTLEGTARDIFNRSVPLVREMIIEIVENEIIPYAQSGTVVTFNRRKNVDGNVSLLSMPGEVYDHIRMLDCEGYPKAFIETEHLRIEFDQADIIGNELTANVRIIKK